MESSEIKTEWSPQKLDSFLHQKYDLGLHPFAFAFEHFLRAGDIHRIDTWPDNQTLIGKENIIKHLKKKILSILIDHESFNGHALNLYVLNKRAPEVVEKIIIREYKLKYFFNRLDNISYEWIRAKRRRGPKRKKRTMIISCWARLISEKEHEINWNHIANLYLWFWKRLKDFKIYDELCADKDDVYPNELKSQFCKNREWSGDIFRDFKNRYDPDDVIVLGKTYFCNIDRRLLKAAAKTTRKIFANKKYIEGLNSFLEGRIDLPLIRRALPYEAYVYYALQQRQNNHYPRIVFPDLTVFY